MLALKGCNPIRAIQFFLFTAYKRSPGLHYHFGDFPSVLQNLSLPLTISWLLVLFYPQIRRIAPKSPVKDTEVLRALGYDWLNRLDVF